MIREIILGIIIYVFVSMLGILISKKTNLYHFSVISFGLGYFSYLLIEKLTKE